MEKNFELEDLSVMCDLPAEILIRIFAGLPLQDRKSVRLTCKSWYELSTSLSIIKNEKLVFRTDSNNIEGIAEAMQKSKFSNFKFLHIPINRLPANIWEVCGGRISSLEFSNCIEINVKTIKNIVIHCENIISFTFRDRSSQLGLQIFSSLDFLDKLIRNGIQRTKLRTFAMLIDEGNLKRKVVLDKLFLVYPCITRLTVAYMSPEWYSYLPVSIESLTFEETRLDHNSKHLMEMLEPGLRLRHLDGKFDGSGDFCTRDEILFNFFSSQRSLNTVRLSMPPCRNLDIKRITFHILESCPDLQKFRINFSHPPRSIPVLNLELEEFSHFLSLISKLQCLALGFMVLGDSNIFLRKTVEPPLFGKNFALTSLELLIPMYSKRTDNLYTALLQRCPQLLHLKLDSVSDYMLQTIFEYLPKLQTLCMETSHLCTAYGFTGHSASIKGGYSIKRLQQLKYLRIDDFHKLKGIQEIVLEFQFPYLECLELDIDVKILPEEVVIRLSSQIPNLRQLYIACRSVSEEAWRMEIFNFCKHFKNLQSLFTDSKYCNSNEFQDFVVQQKLIMRHDLKLFSFYKSPAYMF